MSGMNLQASMWTVVSRSFIMFSGCGMIFPNTSAAALSCVSPERIGHASSLYNMLRNTGAAIGIAFMTNTLVSHEQIHQSRLVEHLSVFDVWRLSTVAPALPGLPRFNYLGQLTSGQPAGLGLLYHVVQAQAAMLAFNDIYRVIAFALIPLIPLFLLLPRSRTGQTAAH
jgi:DHA2 family multidrug resistance protein